ncbi:class I SAM-dependent methyltransferase [Thauera sp.]|jgi:SAM-dependent methyltransferase|uniref:class I SAM-dependent methyltransferase n=1 Tax=Thauera sp. TaxID=1905334 RepID=UPI002A36EE9D|nr:class I SAM-dependent methyltransferase [Thauera sp.]MDX9886611.1 class I SAM-dependent methyltransferase [Thauera sp.]
MPPALKALLAQLIGSAVALLLARNGLVAGLWQIVATQAASAAVAAALLRSARWWLPIHLGFVPLLVAAQSLGLHPAWHLAAFVALVLVYWTSFRTQVPLYLSNRRTAAAVVDLLPAAPARLLDIGAGTGSLLRPLARARPDCQFIGVELAPATWLIGHLLAARQPNIDCQRGDIFARTWQDFDVVYAFLSPVPMAAVWRKAAAELRPGALLVSNSFPVPERDADFVVDVDDRRRTRLYGYRIPPHATP